MSRLDHARALIAAAPVLRKMRAGTAKWEDVRSLGVQFRAAGHPELGDLLEQALVDRKGTPSEVIGDLLEQGSSVELAGLMAELNAHPAVREIATWLDVVKAFRGR